MNNTTIKILETTKEIKAACPVMKELRTSFTEEELFEMINQQRADGYHLVGAMTDQEVIGVAGFWISYKLAWGKHIYVDDLVTSSNNRSSGVGTEMLQWIKEYALANACTQLHLDSGVQRFAAHRFYLRNGFIIASHHFSIPDLSS